MSDKARRRPSKIFLATSRALCFCGLIVLSICFANSRSAKSQTTDAQPEAVLRIRARPKVNGVEKGLARKRFYLFKGGLEENKALVDRISQQSPITRECFYRNAGASAELIKWLKDGDCETVYCREIEAEAIKGSSPVCEFKAAYELSKKEYTTEDLGRRWLTTNLPAEIRDGFYRQTKTAIANLLGAAGRASNAQVISVMTDGKGSAHFTDLAPGTYLVTNLVPIELGGKFNLWIYEVTFKAGGSLKKTLQIPHTNLRDMSIKGSVIEKPLPTCAPKSPVVLCK